jgi:uncharacterized Zn-binding protein involved in type VI secretion
MAKAARARRDCVGLGGLICTGSCDVLIENSPAARVGDTTMPHLSLRGNKHPPSCILSGACDVRVNNRPLAHVGSITSCFDAVLTGSCQVEVGNITASGVPNLLSPGTQVVDGRIVYENTNQGISSLVNEESQVGSSLPTYHENTPSDAGAESAPTPLPIPLNGCTNSAYFKLADSKMPIEAQNGFTKEQIECNWIALCTNILDRLVQDGFKFRITSAFRTTAYNNYIGGSNNSDHSIGCAVDISATGNPSQAEKQDFSKRVFKHMLNNYSYSQLIYEGNWVHVAYQGRQPKGDSKVMYTYTGTNLIAAGATGANLPPELRA